MEIVFRHFIKGNFNSPIFFFASVYFHFYSQDNEDFFFGLFLELVTFKLITQLIHDFA